MCSNIFHVVELQLVSLNANGQAVLLESIVSNLLSCLNDPSPVVRQLCLKGLASVSHLAEEQVRILHLRYVKFFFFFPGR